MPGVGEHHKPQVTVDPYDVTTAVTMVVIRGDNTQFEPALTSTDDGHTWEGDFFEFTTPGEWWLVTTVTNTGARRITVKVVVDPFPGPPSGRAYATTADLANFMGSVPDGAGYALIKATEEIDRALISARYPVDDDGEPTETEHIAALRDATCAQVKWWDDIGTDDPASAAMFQSASIGGVSLGRNAGVPSSGNPDHPVLCRRAWTILVTSGLTNHGPLLYGGYA